MASSDLVKRLRYSAQCDVDHGFVDQEARKIEAADRIEVLEALLLEAREFARYATLREVDLARVEALEAENARLSGYQVKMLKAITMIAVCEYADTSRKLALQCLHQTSADLPPKVKALMDAEFPDEHARAALGEKP